MHTTQYLYAIDPSVIEDMPYKQVLQLKYDKAKALVGRLYEEHYSKRDDERMNAAYKAVSHNRKLLEELEESRKESL